MQIKLRNISRHFAASFAGIQNNIKIVVPAQVLSYTDSQAEGGITVSAGNEIYEVTADPRSGRVREALADSVHGHSHTRSLIFTLRRLDQDKTELRTLLMNRRVHIIFTDNNCQTYVYLNMKMATGTEASNGGGRNETVMQFSGASRNPAPFVNLVLLPAPTGPAQGTGVAEGTDTVFGPVSDGGGVLGGDPNNPDDDIGGTTPTDGGGGGGVTDPPATPAGRAVARQPSTGDLFEIIIGQCEELITIPYVE